MHKLRIGVLLGGMSQEKEVSLNSGRTMCDHLDTSHYIVVPLFQASHGKLYILPWHFLHRGKISDFEHRLDLEAETIAWDTLKETIDFMYIAQHGRFAEDGRLQGLLEVLQIPYCGSKILPSALGMDKTMQRYFLKAAGINVPEAVIIKPDEVDEAALSVVTFPCVVKPSQEGSSIGVSFVTNKQDLKPAIMKAMTTSPGIKQSVLIEEYIEGMEFSCIILTDYKNKKLLPLPPSEIVINESVGFFDYEQKYMPGKAAKHTPARCTPKQQLLIQETCIAVMKALGITNLARIDGFLTRDNRVIIIDPNTFAGMDPASFSFLQAAEINMGHTQLINHLIETELYLYNMLTTYNDRSSTTKSLPQKLRVAVLMGGKSNEREISLASGRNITYKLSPHKYEVTPFFVSSNLDLYKIDQRLLVRNTTAEIEAALTPDMRILWSDLPQHTDFAFIGLHGGEGENGGVQGALEMLRVPYNGSSVLASALCMDKYKTAQFLKYKGFDTPEGTLVSREDWQIKQTALLAAGYPRIVKPHDDGCSVMVQKVHNEEEMRTAVEEIFKSGKNHALIEECVRGIELTVGVIGNKKPHALPPSMAVASAGILSIEEKFLPGAGENQTPAPLPKDTLAFVKQVMENVYSAIGCKGYVRIDCFFQPAQISPTGIDRVIILEINTLPGMTPATCIFHQAAEIGLRPMDFIDIIVQLGLEEHAPNLLEKNPDILIEALAWHHRSGTTLNT
jgi:D-alanine-D-alanine ligase